MEVALHVRVSTTRQQQHQTIAQQLSRLRAYGARTPIGIWPTSTSTGMTAIVALHSSAPVLTDSEIGQMLLVDALTQHGCRVEFIERPMSDDPHDHLLSQIRSAVAEYECTLIAERMRRGAKLRRGQLLPWTRAP